jgi:hypothetical protein
MAALVIGKDEGKKIEENNKRRFAMMRHILLMAVLTGGVIISLLSSCATVPTEPFTPGELRLLRVDLPGGETIRFGMEYPVNIGFIADSQPEIKRICIYYSGEGPYWILNWTVSTRTIMLWARADRTGQYRLECYAEYIQDGKIRRTNSVGTFITFIR